MRQKLLLAICLLCLLTAAFAKPKVIAFGHWLPVKWMVGPQEETAVDIKVRALMVNGEAKDFTIGDLHEVTDRVFVVQRAVRLNDSLPGDAESKPKWKWRPAGWLLVERPTAHITKLNLPDFDAFSSNSSWYRDYVAYCGISDNGEKIFATVMQIGRHKPLLKKLLGPAKNPDLPDQECAAPVWQKQPVRVTFEPKGGEKVSFSIQNFAVEIAPEQAPAQTDDDSQ